MKWLAVALALPLLLIASPLIAVVILGVLAAQAISSPATGTPTVPPPAGVPVNLTEGSWPEFLAAHYEQSGHLNQGDTLTGVAVAVLFWNAGCRGQRLVDIVAISGRESGWGPTAYNFHAHTTGDISLGLTQINVMGSMMGRLQSFGLADPRQLLEPHNAAHATVILSDGCTNLSPWGGYKGMSNTYGTNMARAIAAVTSARVQGLIGE